MAFHFRPPNIVVVCVLNVFKNHLILIIISINVHIELMGWQINFDVALICLPFSKEIKALNLLKMLSNDIISGSDMNVSNRRV